MIRIKNIHNHLTTTNHWINHSTQNLTPIIQNKIQIPPQLNQHNHQNITTIIKKKYTIPHFQHNSLFFIKNSHHQYNNHSINLFTKSTNPKSYHTLSHLIKTLNNNHSNPHTNTINIHPLLNYQNNTTNTNNYHKLNHTNQI